MPINMSDQENVKAQIRPLSKIRVFRRWNLPSYLSEKPPTLRNP
jgi:hypothetical protein